MIAAVARSSFSGDGAGAPCHRSKCIDISIRNQYKTKLEQEKFGPMNPAHKILTSCMAAAVLFIAGRVGAASDASKNEPPLPSQGLISAVTRRPSLHVYPGLPIYSPPGGVFTPGRPLDRGRREGEHNPPGRGFTPGRPGRPGGTRPNPTRPGVGQPNASWPITAKPKPSPTPSQRRKPSKDQPN